MNDDDFSFSTPLGHEVVPTAHGEPCGEVVIRLAGLPWGDLWLSEYEPGKNVAATVNRSEALRLSNAETARELVIRHDPGRRPLLTGFCLVIEPAQNVESHE